MGVGDLGRWVTVGAGEGIERPAIENTLISVARASGSQVLAKAAANGLKSTIPETESR